MTGAGTGADGIGIGAGLLSQRPCEQGERDGNSIGLVTGDWDVAGPLCR